MKKYEKIIIVVALVVIAGMMFTEAALAQDLKKSLIDNIKLVNQRSRLPDKSPSAVVGIIIQGVLGVLVVIFFVFIFVAGFKWMTAGGNPETIEKSKKIIGNAFLGLLIVVLSYVITMLVFGILLVSTGGE